MSVDPCSLANIHEVVTQSVQLDLALDFESSTLSGSVSLVLKPVVPEVTKVVLDTRDLEIKTVTLLPDTVVEFKVGETEPIGAPLSFSVPPQKGEFTVKVEYATKPSSLGLQWLPPAQTEGKKHPYLFSQFQAIHCRSAIPLQDSPSVKAPYKASVTVQAPLTCLMSAISIGKQEKDNQTVFEFEQKVPVPSYLIALFAGELESRDIGPRSRVWAEPSVVERAAYEFEETESYLAGAEEILTPYEWGRYDLLCLPGSFPFGGMENPCLTTLTPTLLAGDRSLSNVVAHEIAHSWTGNLVTNKDWENFWLNEGFTVYVERALIGKLFGEPRRQFAALLGAQALADSIDHFGETHPYTSLSPTLSNVDPDDAFSSVPYEKGFQFLYYLETLVGTKEFQLCLREWIKNNRLGHVTSSMWRDHFTSTFGEDVSKKVEWEKWFNDVGYPPVDVKSLFDKSLAVASAELATSWAEAPETGPKDASAKDIEGWSSAQTVHFLEALSASNENGLSKEKLTALGDAYGFSKTKNSEIRMRWLSLCLKSKDERAFDQVIAFLGEQGRMKFVRPLFRLLNSVDADLAKKTFEKLGNGYNNIAKRMIAQDLKVSA